MDRVDVTYDEDISGSTFEAGDWTFPTNPHGLSVLSGVISGTDVQITVGGAPSGCHGVECHDGSVHGSGYIGQYYGWE
ncbi:MAG: hypothetical protein IIB44_12900 [Candidatus Marinimicrobia bacterium]|nr:hypothetical protein [Candidatus Neomarinimicrobiota bacterium]